MGMTIVRYLLLSSENRKEMATPSTVAKSSIRFQEDFDASVLVTCVKCGGLAIEDDEDEGVCIKDHPICAKCFDVLKVSNEDDDEISYHCNACNDTRNLYDRDNMLQVIISKMTIVCPDCDLRLSIRKYKEHIVECQRKYRCPIFDSDYCSWRMRDKTISEIKDHLLSHDGAVEDAKDNIADLSISVREMKQTYKASKSIWTGIVIPLNFRGRTAQDHVIIPVDDKHVLLSVRRRAPVGLSSFSASILPNGTNGTNGTECSKTSLQVAMVSPISRDQGIALQMSRAARDDFVLSGNLNESLLRTLGVEFKEVKADSWEQLKADIFREQMAKTLLTKQISFSSHLPYSWEMDEDIKALSEENGVKEYVAKICNAEQLAKIESQPNVMSTLITLAFLLSLGADALAGSQTELYECIEFAVDAMNTRFPKLSVRRSP
jgi:hypothetical protein